MGYLFIFVRNISHVAFGLIPLMDNALEDKQIPLNAPSALPGLSSKF